MQEFFFRESIIGSFSSISDRPQQLPLSGNYVVAHDLAGWLHVFSHNYWLIYLAQKMDGSILTLLAASRHKGLLQSRPPSCSSNGCDHSYMRRINLFFIPKRLGLDWNEILDRSAGLCPLFEDSWQAHCRGQAQDENNFTVQRLIRKWTAQSIVIVRTGRSDDELWRTQQRKKSQSNKRHTRPCSSAKVWVTPTPSHRYLTIWII